MWNYGAPHVSTYNYYEATLIITNRDVGIKHSAESAWGDNWEHTCFLDMHAYKWMWQITITNTTIYSQKDYP